MKGRCLCGAIGFKLTSKIPDSYVCHCRDCQFCSGSAFITLAIVEKKAYQITNGKPEFFTHPTQDNSTLTRYFCSNCSSSMFNTSSRFDDIVMFSVSTLDEPDKVKPSFQIWTSSKLSWLDLVAGLISYPYGAEDGNGPPGL